MFEDYTKGTFIDYKKEVLQAYLKRKNDHKLPSDLENPSPSQLRSLSLRTLVNRYSTKDDEVLKDFFDPKNKYEDHEKSIEKVELSKFKPLINFLKGETKDSEDKNIKLLAWLIDYESYEDWRARKRNVQLEHDLSPKVSENKWHEEDSSIAEEVESEDEKGVETGIKKEDTEEIVSKVIVNKKKEDGKKVAVKAPLKKWAGYLYCSSHSRCSLPHLGVEKAKVHVLDRRSLPTDLL